MKILPGRIAPRIFNDVFLGLFCLDTIQPGYIPRRRYSSSEYTIIDTSTPYSVLHNISNETQYQYNQYNVNATT